MDLDPSSSYQIFVTPHYQSVMKAALFLCLFGYAAGAAQKAQTQWDLHGGLNFIGKAAVEAMDPTKNHIFDQPQAAQVMENTVFPLLDKYLPGGLPKVENANGLKPSSQLNQVSKNAELNVKLET